MAIFLRSLASAALVVAFQLVSACGQDCGDGTTRQGDSCVPTSFTCGSGTVLSDGVCVAVVDGCGDGTTLIEGQCTLADGGEPLCAEGTQYDVGVGRCVATAASACGTNTIAVEDTCVVAGRVQIIHALETANSDLVDLYVDGLLAVNDFAYRTATRFISVPAGARSIAIALADSNEVIGAPIPDDDTAETTVNVNPVSDIVAVLRGTSTATFGAASRQLPRAADAGNVAFTFAHAAPDLPATLDLEDEGADRTTEADDTTLVDDLAYGTASPVVTVEAARLVFAIAEGSGSDGPRYRIAWDALGGSALTLVASGFFAADDEAHAFSLLSFSKDGGAGTVLPLFE